MSGLRKDASAILSAMPAVPSNPLPEGVTFAFAIPSLDDTFGAILIATFIGLVSVLPCVLFSKQEMLILSF